MSEDTSLANLLPWEFEKVSIRISTGIEGTEELAGLRRLMARLSPAQWGTVLPALADKVRELLDIPVAQLLPRAWKDLTDVREALESTRRSPGRAELVALADHSIESEHKPYLEIYENGQRIDRIPFSVLVEIELRAMILEIQEGTIRKANLGDVRMKGTLKTGELTILKKEFERVRLPGSIRFDKGASDVKEST